MLLDCPHINDLINLAAGVGDDEPTEGGWYTMAEVLEHATVCDSCTVILSGYTRLLE